MPAALFYRNRCWSLEFSWILKLAATNTRFAVWIQADMSLQLRECFLAFHYRGWCYLETHWRMEALWQLETSKWPDYSRPIPHSIHPRLSALYRRLPCFPDLVASQIIPKMVICTSLWLPKFTRMTLGCAMRRKHLRDLFILCWDASSFVSLIWMMIWSGLPMNPNI